MVTWFNIAPFIATLAMMTIARGVALIISKGQPVFIDNDAFVNFGTGHFLDPFACLCFPRFCHYLPIGIQKFGLWSVGGVDRL